jgi:hypothetical protein
VQRVLVVFVFSNYLILSPSLSNHQCGTAAWTGQLLGWVLITIFYVLVSMQLSPLVRLGIGYRDEWISHSMVLCTNAALWEACGCALHSSAPTEGGDIKGYGMYLGTTLAVALLFFVVLRWGHYTTGKGSRHSWGVHFFSLMSRMTLLVMGIGVCTLVLTGPLFAWAGYVREIWGCQGVILVPLNTATYRHLRLPGLPAPPQTQQDGTMGSGVAMAQSVSASVLSESSVFPHPPLPAHTVSVPVESHHLSAVTGGLLSLQVKASAMSAMTTAEASSLRLNESLLVGLHNSYHQSPPLASLVQSWGYSHPSLYDQLTLGYREIEIDVHWERNGQDWRVFHVILMDQRTSCTCLSDCLGQVRRWMDEPVNADHSPIWIHLEPRGYKYHDLFCERKDAQTRMLELQQEVFDMFNDRLYYPDELTDGFQNIHEALSSRGWPSVKRLRGKILFNLNLFSSNMACKELYWKAAGASFSARLPKSDRVAKDVGFRIPLNSDPAAESWTTTAAIQVWQWNRQR